MPRLCLVLTFVALTCGARAPEVSESGCADLPVEAPKPGAVRPQKSAVPPPPEIPEAQWEEFEGEGWTALFPGKPVRSKLPAPGDSFVMFMHSVQPDKNSMFAVGQMSGQLPPERRKLPAEQLLDDACDGSAANLKAMGAEEVSRTPIELGDYPGKELVMYTSEGRGHIIARCYLADGQLYIIMCGGRGYEPCQHNVEKFFGSFKIE